MKSTGEGELYLSDSGYGKLESSWGQDTESSGSLQFLIFLES
jgi:hypothetical protein